MRKSGRSPEGALLKEGYVCCCTNALRAPSVAAANHVQRTDFPESRANPSPERDTEVAIEEAQQVWVEPPWRVLIHNDDVTTFEFVERILQTIFKLSREIAETIAWRAHTEGIALVCVRPRSEAERLVGQAIFAARLEGFPLLLTCEPDT
ncbi:MAG: ATP-dependent Clp protease adaptor ClpS [Anaerolineae bacterium]|nr:ATP-dependent Clp protease adaptor ClpS [Anaerolineae bacterium]